MVLPISCEHVARVLPVVPVCPVVSGWSGSSNALRMSLHFIYYYLLRTYLRTDVHLEDSRSSCLKKKTSWDFDSQ